jgi:endo-1,3(4)-beta-glucanase
LDIISSSTGVGISVSYLHQYLVKGPMNDNGAIQFYYYPATIKNWVFSSMEWQQNLYLPDFQIQKWDDVGVNIQLSEPSSSDCFMETFLSIGNAFMSVKYHQLQFLLRTDHAILTINGLLAQNGLNYTNYQFILELNNGQKWILFMFPSTTSTGSNNNHNVTLHFQNHQLYTSSKFAGIAQIAIFPDTESVPKLLKLYQRCAGTRVIGGRLIVEDDRTLEFQWDLESCTGASSISKRTWLHFGLEHHKQMIDARFVQEETSLQLYSHTKGQMYAYTLRSSEAKWRFEIPQQLHDLVYSCLNFYPPRECKEEEALHLCSVLKEEVQSDWNASMPEEGSYYFKGKSLQKYGSMCLLGRKLSSKHPTIMSEIADLAVEKFKKLMIRVGANNWKYPLVYDTLYKGIITSEALTKHDIYVDFGNAIYNDHHYHYGYFIVAAAIIYYLDPTWMRSQPKLIEFIETLIRDVANGSDDDPFFPKYRHFDWFLGHSFSHGVTPMADGKDEESTSEEINFFYGLSLWGHVTSNCRQEKLGRLMLSLNSAAINTYFFMTDDNITHPEEFRKNKITGIFFDNKCDYTTWFSPQKECIHGIQMLPVSPIIEAVRYKKFIQEEWDQVLCKVQVPMSSGWKSILSANLSVLNSQEAIHILKECQMDDGLSRAWALYFAYTRESSTQSSLFSSSTSEADFAPLPNAHIAQLKRFWKTKFTRNPHEVDNLLTSVNLMSSRQAKEATIDQKVNLLAHYLMQNEL